MALGRGLGEILSEVEEAYEKDLSNIDSFELEAQGARVEDLDVSSIAPNPFQPRKHFDEKALQELSDSIKEHGLLQPIVVIEKEDGYLLVAGERRLRAHKLAKLQQIKAIVAQVDIGEIRLRELALIENIQRENLNAIELANSYAELIEVHSITHDELSDIVHKSRSQITNTMRLLSLGGYAQKELISGKISQGHAKVLIGLDEEKQKILIQSILGQKLSVRDTEKMIKSYREKKTLSTAPERKYIFIEPYRAQLSRDLPFSHKIKANSIEISFKNEDEVEAFLSLLHR
ncbi:MAG: ParB family transcriptional regulator, chromosome partitioning protein [Campylobacterota bacterium]|nr:ParB family transcriptional regulator, chromosome partitioning protein [Campylobacterota bacterium]